MVMVLAALHSLALREWWPLYSVDLCGPWSLAGLPGWGAAVGSRLRALVRVLLFMCPWALEVG